MKIKAATLERKASLKGATHDVDTRTVRAALSSEQPVQRIFGAEVLVHEEGAIDLSRAGDGLPLLVNHNDARLPIGRVRNVALEDGVLRGDLAFSEATQDAREAWELAREGTVSDVSIRYSINRYEVIDEGKASEQYRITDWTPLEASVVAVPADPTVGINRKHEGTTMPDETPAPEVPETPAPVNHAASRLAGKRDGETAERQRASQIRSLGQQFTHIPEAVDLTSQALDSDISVEAFQRQLLDTLAGEPATPSGQPLAVGSDMRVASGPTAAEKMCRGIEEALNFRMGNLKGEDLEKARQNEYTSLSLTEIGRRFLEAGGISTRGMTPVDVAGVMLTRAIDPGTVPAAGISTYFPDLLENVGNKSLFQGFQEAPTTYQLWTGTMSSRDFKQGSVPGLSHFTSLTVNAENTPIADGTMEDKKEVFQVQTYAAKYALTRQALVNDDLGGFADVARKMGIAAGRTLDEQVYAFVEANGAMNEDGFTLFDEVNHNNAPAAAGDPSTANISTARTRMGKQVDWNNVLLGIAPQYMVVPLELERQMLELQSQITGLDPDATGQMRDNIYRTMWAPVASPRLTDANDWYMFGARGEHINVVFLNNQTAPMLARDEGWSVMSAHWRVVFDFDVMAVDWRSAIKFVNS